LTMKNNVMLTIVLIAIVSSQLNAQDFDPLSKSNYVIGGGVGLDIFNNEAESNDNNDRINEFKGYSFTLRPSVGKFIKDRLAIGGSLLLTSAANDNTADNEDLVATSESNSFRIGAGVFLRKYYPIVGKFGAFIQPELSLSTSSTETKNSEFDKISQVSSLTSTLDSDGLQVNLGASLGLYVLLGKKFSLETNLGNLSYNYAKIERETAFPQSGTQASDTRTSGNINFSIISEISLDRLLVINFFF